jgi:hypothetical protein
MSDEKPEPQPKIHTRKIKTLTCPEHGKQDTFLTKLFSDDSTMYCPHPGCRLPMILALDDEN